MTQIEFKESNSEELNKLLDAEIKALHKARFELHTTEMKDHSIIKKHRKNIARIKTEANLKGVKLNG